MSTRQIVIETIAEELYLNPGIVSTYSRLEDDLGADSLDRAQLEISLEEALGVDSLDLTGVETVQDVLDRIEATTSSA